MIRRNAVTLMEVLVTMFIMAIGMLALLALFPLGAVSMAHALKDDRCASAASMAEQFAIAKDVRHDSLVMASFASQPAPATPNLPSIPVYVDPYGVQGGLTQLGSAIHRTSASYAGGVLVDYWFSLPNDIGFLSTGTPDLSAGNVERGRDYTWAYMLRRPQALSDACVDLSVVVYRKRPTAVPNVEQTYIVTPAAVQGASGLVLTWNAATQSPNLKRGVWLLDATPITGTAIPRADFYRVVNVSDSGAGSAALDVQPNIIGTSISQVILMDDVAEVFQKGTSWQP